MNNRKRVGLLYGRRGVQVDVPVNATILRGGHGEVLARPGEAIRTALEKPIGSHGLSELLRRRKPKTAVITISDITRPVPNTVILPEILATLNANGVSDQNITIVVGTGMHRASTDAEKVELVGNDILKRVRIEDHVAEDPAGLLRVTTEGEEPVVFANKTFLQADFKIVTGLIEPHFMAGYSGGRKGVCPALVDLKTVQRFHGHRVMGDMRSASGILEGNPCHAESLRIARRIGADFLVNVAINGERQVCGVYAGDMEAAHAVGVKHVERWTSAVIEEPFDLVVTCGGGYPLDKTFYQTGKGMVTALPACHKGTIVLVVAECEEGVGSESFTELMTGWSGKWREFLAHIAGADVKKDQWQVQMLTRVMEAVGTEQVLLVCDGLQADIVRKLWVTPVEGAGTAAQRAQRVIDDYIAKHPAARIAVIPEGPYTMLLSSQPDNATINQLSIE
jgi:nickel-dependent lactate racemase